MLQRLRKQTLCLIGHRNIGAPAEPLRRAPVLAIHHTTI
jgi:hypothetical protein